MHRIHVMDMDGNCLQDTYARRAKGLVAKGRAYYVSEHTIGLLYERGKESKMENLTKDEILANIHTMLTNNTYMKEAYDAIEKLSSDLSEEQVTLRVNAIIEIVSRKEETNRALVALWTVMIQEENNSITKE